MSRSAAAPATRSRPASPEGSDGHDAAPASSARSRRRPPTQPPSGHVFRVERKAGAVWYAKYRLPDGRQVQRKIGPAWSERGRPPAGYFTKRLAEDWLRSLLDEARRGTLPGLVRTGVTVKDAAEEYMVYIEHDRERKPSTVKGYRWIIDSQILPALGHMQIEDVTTEDVEAWLANMRRHAKAARGGASEDHRVDAGAKPPTASSRRKALVILHGIFKRARKVHKLPFNPVTDVEKPPLSASGDIQVFSPQEIHSLVRAAENAQDGTIYLTAAFTGLRLGELIARSRSRGLAPLSRVPASCMESCGRAAR